jgi:hypothetical protein
MVHLKFLSRLLHLAVAGSLVTSSYASVGMFSLKPSSFVPSPIDPLFKQSALAVVTVWGNGLVSEGKRGARAAASFKAASRRPNPETDIFQEETGFLLDGIREELAIMRLSSRIKIRVLVVAEGAHSLIVMESVEKGKRKNFLILTRTLDKEKIAIEGDPLWPTEVQALRDMLVRKRRRIKEPDAGNIHIEKYYEEASQFGVG